MPIIEVEGQRFEFPEGTTDEVIGQSIRSFFGDQPAPEQPIQQPQQEIQDDSTRVSSNILPNRTGANAFQNVAREKFGIAEDLPPPESPLRVIEPAAAIASGIVAEPAAGLAGIVQSINPFADQGAGARAVEATREALTFQPRTPEGQEGLEAVGEALGGVTETLQAIDNFAGDSVFEATGSPALAAMAKAGPTLAIELLTLGTGRGIKSVARSAGKRIEAGKIQTATAKAAPQIDQLKEAASAIYKELDDSGITLKTNAYNAMVKKIVSEATDSGFSRRTGGVLLPKSNAVINALEEGVESGVPFTLREIDSLRKQAGIAVKAIDNPADSAVSSSIISSIDEFLDKAGDASLNKGGIPSAEVGPKYKAARELWGRSRRAEVLNEAIFKAGNQASGFENGIVTQFRSILNNKKTRKMFKPAELKAIKDVVDGDFKRTFAKLVGKFGFSEGHATGLIGGSLGVAGGATLFGPAGAVAVPLIGQVSKKLAQRLAVDKSNFANQVVRAGANADEIVRAYIRNTPKAKRSSAELSELLMRPEVSLKTSSKNPLIIDAIDTAKGNRVLSAVVAAQAAREPIKEAQN